MASYTPGNKEKFKSLYFGSRLIPLHDQFCTMHMTGLAKAKALSSFILTGTVLEYLVLERYLFTLFVDSTFLLTI